MRAPRTAGLGAAEPLAPLNVGLSTNHPPGKKQVLSGDPVLTYKHILSIMATISWVLTSEKTTSC